MKHEEMLLEFMSKVDGADFRKKYMRAESQKEIKQYDIMPRKQMNDIIIQFSANMANYFYDIKRQTREYSLLDPHNCMEFGTPNGYNFTGCCQNRRLELLHHIEMSFKDENTEGLIGNLSAIKTVSSRDGLPIVCLFFRGHVNIKHFMLDALRAARKEIRVNNKIEKMRVWGEDVNESNIHHKARHMFASGNLNTGLIGLSDEQEHYKIAPVTVTFLVRDTLVHQIPRARKAQGTESKVNLNGIEYHKERDGCLRSYNAEMYIHSHFDQPAVIDDMGNSFWYQNGLLHREDGPAVLLAGKEKGKSLYFAYGKRVEQNHED